MTDEAKDRIPPLDGCTLEAIAKVIGDSDRGLTGSQLGHKLRQCSIPDVDPTNTNWKRLYNAFVEFQNKHNFGNHVVKFIMQALSPTAFTGEPERFEERRQALNAVLSFVDMELGVDGNVRHTSRASNIEDALASAITITVVYDTCPTGIPHHHGYLFERSSPRGATKRVYCWLESDGLEPSPKMQKALRGNCVKITTSALRQVFLDLIKEVARHIAGGGDRRRIEGDAVYRHIRNPENASYAFHEQYTKDISHFFRAAQKANADCPSKLRDLITGYRDSEWKDAHSVFTTRILSKPPGESFLVAEAQFTYANVRDVLPGFDSVRFTHAEGLLSIGTVTDAQWFRPSGPMFVDFAEGATIRPDSLRDLQALLSKNPMVLLEGPPASGKSTLVLKQAILGVRLGPGRNGLRGADGMPRPAAA